MTNAFEISKIDSYIGDVSTNFEKRDCIRLLHGRGGTFKDLSFINIDLYPPAFFVTLYEKRSEQWMETLSLKIIGKYPSASLIFQDRTSAPWKNFFFGLPLPEPHIIREDGLQFQISLHRGENPGLFPDMAAGRALVRSIARGKKVLNLFAYTCAFSVAAMAGGADSVLNMDMNRNSLSRGRKNHRLNGQNMGKVKFLDHNILKSFGKIVREGPFDLVIIDPPPSQGSSFRLERDYGKILRKTGDFLGPGGEIIACLNSHHHDFGWFHAFLKENLGEPTVLKTISAGENFPEIDPGKGLKIVYLQI